MQDRSIWTGWILSNLSKSTNERPDGDSLVDTSSYARFTYLEDESSFLSEYILQAIA